METISIQLTLAQPALVLIPTPASQAPVAFTNVLAGRDGDYSVPEQIPGFTSDLLSAYLQTKEIV